MAVCLHLRDSVVYEVPEGIAVRWVPLAEGTVDFKAIVARASELLPDAYIYCNQSRPGRQSSFRFTRTNSGPSGSHAVDQMIWHASSASLNMASPTTNHR